MISALAVAMLGSVAISGLAVRLAHRTRRADVAARGGSGSVLPTIAAATVARIGSATIQKSSERGVFNAIAIVFVILLTLTDCAAAPPPGSELPTTADSPSTSPTATSPCDHCRHEFQACYREHYQPRWPDYEPCRRGFRDCASIASIREGCQMPDVPVPRANVPVQPPPGSTGAIEH